MKNEQATVTVTIGEKEFSKTYTKKIAENAEDMLAMLSDEKQAKDVISCWNYGSDLKAKAQVRNLILAAEAGPEKAFDKAVKDLMKLRESVGKPITEEKAKEMVKMLQGME